MNKTELLKSVFDLAHQGIYVSLDNLPNDISRDVVEKNLLYIEMQNLINNGGSQERIEEIKAILYPLEEEVESNGN